MLPAPRMPDEANAPESDLDERGIGKKYGIRALVYPDTDQVKTLSAFLAESDASGRCGPIPRTAVVVTLEFLQGTLVRQSITKSPRMSQQECELLQAPYYLAARIVARILRDRQESARGRLYASTAHSLHRFVQLLRDLLDPNCLWLRTKTIPEEVRESMYGLREFLLLYAEQRRREPA
jgi:hypothetical protein